MTGRGGERISTHHYYPAQQLTTSQVAADRKVRLASTSLLSHSPSADAYPVLLPPINFIFKLLQQRATVSIWLYENLGLRIEGKLRVRSNTQAQIMAGR